MNKLKILFLLIFKSGILFSQIDSAIETDLFWLEQGFSFYSTSEDTLHGIPPSFLSCNSPSDSITLNSYVKGSFLYNFLDPLLRDFREIIDKETLFHNDDLVNEYFNLLEYNEPFVQQKYNQYWTYNLCIVTYQKIYLGRHKRLIPLLESSNEIASRLNYIERYIPVYFIKIIHIDPYELK